MRVASPVLGPVLLIELRVLIAGIALIIYSLAIGINLQIKSYWKQYLAIGTINSALPFLLIATAELNLTAGIAAILNATSPLFGAVIAALWIKEALTLKKVTGLLLGLLGVSILVGWSALSFNLILVLSIGASISAAVFYGIGSVLTKVSTRGVNAISLATCSQSAAALFLLPVVPFTLPTGFPDPGVILSVLALSLLCTSVGYLIYFKLIISIGPTKTLTVTFLAPVFGVLWGTIFLGEALNLSTIIGFAVILLGSAYVTGVGPGKKKALPVSQGV